MEPCSLGGLELLFLLILVELHTDGIFFYRLYLYVKSVLRFFPDLLYSFFCYLTRSPYRSMDTLLEDPFPLLKIFYGVQSSYFLDLYA